VTPTAVLLKNQVFWDDKMCCWAAVPAISKNHSALNFRVMQPKKWSCVQSGCTYLQTRALVWVKELRGCLVSGMRTWCTGQAAGSEGRLSFIWDSHGHINFWSGGIQCNMVQLVRHAVYSSDYWNIYKTTGLYPQKIVILISIFPIHVPCFSMHLVQQFESLMISWNKIFQLHLMTSVL
jgi:hypothetical protein